MNKKEADIWHEKYKTLTKNKKYEFMISFFDEGITKDKIKNIDLCHIISDIYEQLKKNRKFDKILALHKKVYAKSHLIEDSFYLDIYIIDYLLYTRNDEALKGSFKNFVKDPVKSIDMLIPLFDKLIYYGYRELSFKIATEVFDRIKNGKGLIGGAESYFGDMIFAEYMQDVYLDLKSNKPLDKAKLLENLKLYDYDLEKQIDKIIKLLDPGSFLLPDYTEYKKDKNSFLSDLSMLFMRHMLDEKGMPFAAARDIWFVSCIYFYLDMQKPEDDDYDISKRLFPWDIQDMDCEDEDEDYDEDYDEDEDDMFIPDLIDPVSGSFDTVFELNKEKMELDLSGRFDFISNKIPNGFAVSWGMVYVYDFLYKYKYISKEIYQDAWEIIADNKAELFSGYFDYLWEYAFITNWGKPDSIEEAEIECEKRYIKESFEACDKNG